MPALLPSVVLFMIQSVMDRKIIGKNSRLHCERAGLLPAVNHLLVQLLDDADELELNPTVLHQLPDGVKIHESHV